MIAILSDVHANLEALDAVLADIAARRVDRVYCLGDNLGYGPDPLPCLDRVMRLPVVLLGNHDAAVLDGGDEFEQAHADRLGLAFHQREVANATVPGGRNRYRDFLLGCPHCYVEDEVLFVHGSPRDPLNEYLFPEDADNTWKMQQNAERMTALCFCGHTHVAGAILEVEAGDWAYHSPAEFSNEWRPDGRKTLVNVGSVGQPRDGDPRASYVLWSGTTVRFVRVDYDVATTIRKVRQSPDIDDMQGDRLAEGR